MGSPFLLKFPLSCVYVCVYIHNQSWSWLVQLWFDCLLNKCQGWSGPSGPLRTGHINCSVPKWTVLCYHHWHCNPCDLNLWFNLCLHGDYMEAIIRKSHARRPVWRLSVSASLINYWVINVYWVYTVHCTGMQAHGALEDNPSDDDPLLATCSLTWTS